MLPSTRLRRSGMSTAFTANLLPLRREFHNHPSYTAVTRHRIASLPRKCWLPPPCYASSPAKALAPRCGRSVRCRSTPPPPPPGREDEFEDANGDDLEASASKSVATLSRDTERSFDTVLQELTAIQQDGPRNVAILGTRYTSYLHQQIIELLTYANVLVGNHVFTSGAGGTNAAVIRGALRAEKPELLTVVLPQSLHKQPKETQEQLLKVQNLIEMKKNDPLPLDVASQLCNSDILSRCTHFIAFAFHDSDVV
eukprot:TRINITY_DN790_c0_g1_i4.p1 TRINITY_DN790_c0_g1~~TRINITY_DN790_c0_g1_i4.p1  ORF type:complete len:296 (-),score=35.77 TRINITY_DN790_c0_g1_i4:737-1498(-)